MTDDAVTVARRDALRESVEHLHSLVTPMDDSQLEAPAYPSQWRIADVLSHIGSAAVIMGERISTGLRGESLPDEFSPAVWDEWNAKSPRAKADDGLAADRAFLDRLLGATDEERAAVTISLGPMSFDFGGIIGLRLNEHVLHTWDVEVAGDPVVGLSRAGTPLVVDSLELIARYTGKPSAAGRTIAVRTTDPGRDFSVTTAPRAWASRLARAAVTLTSRSRPRRSYDWSRPPRPRPHPGGRRRRRVARRPPGRVPRSLRHTRSVAEPEPVERKRHGITGAMLAGAMIAVRDILETPKDQDAVIVQASAEPEDIDGEGMNFMLDPDTIAYTPPLARRPPQHDSQRPGLSALPGAVCALGRGRVPRTRTRNAHARSYTLKRISSVSPSCTS